MRIALTHPSCWPYVRRGAERFLSELGVWLSGRGHEVLTISSAPDGPRRESGESGVRELSRPLWHPALRRLRLQPYHSFPFAVSRTLRRMGPDLVQSLHYVDAYASVRSRRWPTVYYVTGPPVPHHVPRIPPDRWMLRESIVGAEAVLVPSRHVADVVEEFYGVRPQIVPVPIHTARFGAARRAKSEAPLVLSVSAVSDVRKGARPLVQAFARLRARVPEARLRVCAEAPEAARSALLESVPEGVRGAIEFVGPGRLEDLPAQYQEAWVTVLPSKWEAYGLVLLESWASGTPVVATAHAALPELVDDPRTGVLFEPGEGGQEVADIEALADGLERGLELASRCETEALCRAKAAAYSWERLGPAYDRVYDEVLSRAGSRVRRSSEAARSR